MSEERQVWSLWNRHCTPDDCSLEPLQADMQGTVPAWLSGVLYRTGPGIGQYGEDTFKHAFDPTAVLQAFEVRNGQVLYKSRVLECEAYKKNAAAQRITMGEFGTVATPDPCKTILGRFMARFMAIPPDLTEDMTDNCCVSMFFMGDELYASSETSSIVRVDPSDLSVPAPPTKHSDYLAINSATAHTHVDPDGTVFNLGNSMDRGRSIHHICKFPKPTKEKSAHEQASILCSLPSTTSNPSYNHSFPMTESHVLLTEQPFTFNKMRGLFSNVTRTSFEQMLDWNPKADVLIHVFDKATGAKLPLTFVAKPHLCLHQINAFVEDEHIVLDFCASEGSVYRQLYLETLRSGRAELPRTTPRRLVLPLKIDEGKASSENQVRLKDTACEAFYLGHQRVRLTEERLVEGSESMEMPRINYGLNGRKYRYFYACGFDALSGNFTELLKVDTATKRVVARYSQEGFVFSEPVFEGHGEDEDSGVVLSMMHSAQEANWAGLVVLDAKDFRELARASVKTTGPVTPTIHGTFNGNEAGGQILA